MLNRMKRVAAGLLTAVFLFNIAPVSGVNNVAQVEAAKLVTKGKVNSSILNIRTRKSTKAKKITTLKRGAKVTLLSNNSKWVAVKVKGKVGYTQGKYITIANEQRSECCKLCEEIPWKSLQMGWNKPYSWS